MFITMATEEPNALMGRLTIEIGRDTLLQFIELVGMVRRAPHTVSIPHLDACVVWDGPVGNMPESGVLITEEAPYGRGAPYPYAAAFYTCGALIEASCGVKATLPFEKGMLSAWKKVKGG